MTQVAPNIIVTWLKALGYSPLSKINRYTISCNRGRKIVSFAPTATVLMAIATIIVNTLKN
jgi:hypothetical protein